MRGILSYFTPVVTTPNVLTEVNNLVPNGIGPTYFELFAQGIALLQEKYTPSTQIAAHPAFHIVGLTDTGIIKAATQGGYLVITDDFRLRQFLGYAGVDTLNFEELRFQSWSER